MKTEDHLYMYVVRLHPYITIFNSSTIPKSHCLFASYSIYDERLKAGSQYSVRVASRPEVIIFSMGSWTQHDAGIESSSIPALRCVQAH